MCTQTLTSDPPAQGGWDPKMTPFALLLHLKENLIEGGAMVDFRFPYDYSEQEAQEAFNRVARDHGWKIP